MSAMTHSLSPNAQICKGKDNVGFDTNDASMDVYATKRIRKNESICLGLNTKHVFASKSKNRNVSLAGSAKGRHFDRHRFARPDSHAHLTKHWREIPAASAPPVIPVTPVTTVACVIAPAASMGHTQGKEIHATHGTHGTHGKHETLGTQDASTKTDGSTNIDMALLLQQESQEIETFANQVKYNHNGGCSFNYSYFQDSDDVHAQVNDLKIQCEKQSRIIAMFTKNRPILHERVKTLSQENAEMQRQLKISKQECIQVRKSHDSHSNQIGKTQDELESVSPLLAQLGNCHSNSNSESKSKSETSLCYGDRNDKAGTLTSESIFGCDLDSLDKGKQQMIEQGNCDCSVESQRSSSRKSGHARAHAHAPESKVESPMSQLSVSSEHCQSYSESHTLQREIDSLAHKLEVSLANEYQYKMKYFDFCQNLSRKLESEMTRIITNLSRKFFEFHSKAKNKYDEVVARLYKQHSTIVTLQSTLAKEKQIIKKQDTMIQEKQTEIDKLSKQLQYYMSYWQQLDTHNETDNMSQHMSEYPNQYPNEYQTAW